MPRAGTGSENTADAMPGRLREQDEPAGRAHTGAASGGVRTE